MSHLYLYPSDHKGPFPGATFKAYDSIPTSECETAGGATTVQALAELAHSEGKAHTFLNGKLYTDLSVAEMTTHCSVTYAPQT